ncbi:MAG: sugar ABC transporter ATP-binding protein [Pirellulaceae bacterium]|nr:sugar ABC transporter ATP-binding protein [Pirellulaceae bacterium]
MNWLLEVKQVSQRYPGVLALDAIDLQLATGEVLAVAGENGAGKSSLMKILAGVERPSSGEIRIAGQPVIIDSVHSALRHGIALIHQELSLLENLDVGANIYLGREPRRFGLINKRQIAIQSRQLLERVGLNVAPHTLVGDLTIGRQQLVEIARALSVGARIIIMDEPTSSLSPREADRLLQVVRELRSSGVSIIYISHRLAEIEQLADRAIVLRDGQLVGQLSRGQIKHDRLVHMMVGRDLARFYSRHKHKLGSIALEAAGIRTPTWPQQSVSFAIRAGEIVGMAGLVGAGRSEILRALFGIDRSLAGSISIAGQRRHIHSPSAAIAAGMALVPEDRKGQGVVLQASVAENIGLAGLSRFRWAGGLVNRRTMAEHSRQMIEELKIKTPSPRQIVQYLSGGNQQKVVLGKWLCLQPAIVLMDEPTRGIDIGAKHEIYALMERLASQGVAILFVSSDMEEILGMSDRVLVMCEGALTGELTGAEISEQAIMRLATARPGVHQASDSNTTVPSA